MAISISPLELWVPHVHTQTHMVVSYNGGTPKPWISIWYTKIVWVWIPLFSETPTSPMRCYAFSLPSHPVVLHPADLCKLRPRRHWPSHQVKLAQKWNMSYVLYIILYYIANRGLFVRLYPDSLCRSSRSSDDVTRASASALLLFSPVLRWVLSQRGQFEEPLWCWILECLIVIMYNCP